MKTPTDGAMKAAGELLGSDLGDYYVKRSAAIIDREAVAPAVVELVAGLRGIVSCINETRGPDAYYHVENARALLTKYTPQP